MDRVLALIEHHISRFVKTNLNLLLYIICWSSLYSLVDSLLQLSFALNILILVLNKYRTETVPPNLSKIYIVSSMNVHVTKPTHHHL